MSADRDEEGLEFSGFNLAEESAGEWESVSADKYKPVAAVVKLDSFEIDFEPDEEDAGYTRPPRRQSAAAAETNQTKPEETRQEPDRQPSPEPEESAEDSDLMAESLPAAPSSAARSAEEEHTPQPEASSPEPQPQAKPTIPENEPPRANQQRGAAPAHAQESGTEAGGDFGGLLGDLSSSGAEAQTPLFPSDLADDFPPDMADDFASDDFAEEDFPPDDLPPEAPLQPEEFANQPELPDAPDFSDVPAADDILGSLPPLREEDFFSTAADQTPEDSAKERYDPEEESEPEQGSKTSAKKKKRRTSSAQTLEPITEEEPERVPLKLRGRLTEDPFARKKPGAKPEAEEDGDLLGGLGLGFGPDSPEGDEGLSDLLRDFSVSEDSDLPDGFGTEEDEANLEDLRKPQQKRRRAAEADVPDLDPDLSSEFALPDFSSLAEDSFAPEAGDGLSLVDEVEGSIDDLLFHAKEVTGGGKKKARKKVPEMQDDLDGVDLGDDLAGWGNGGIPSSGDEIDLSGMGFDEDLEDGSYEDYPGLEASFEPQPLTEAQLFSRKVRRAMRRIPNAKEFTQATLAWLKLLQTLPACIKQEKNLVAGTMVWLEKMRELAGMEGALLSPASWRKTRYPEEEEEDRRTSSAQLPGYEEDYIEDELLSSPTSKEKKGADFSGWGMEMPDAASDEPTSSADLDGLIPAADSWDVPGEEEDSGIPKEESFDGMEEEPAVSSATGDTFPEDAEEEIEEDQPEEELPEEDLSFSTADMLMQDSELGLSDLENEFDLSDSEEAETPDQIPVGEGSGWQGLWRLLCKAARKWMVLCYRSLDHHVGFEDNWWKIVDFIALVILTMAAAAFLSYWLYYAN